MSQVKVSQSLIKGFTDYLNKKECGLLFKAKYIDKTVESKASEAMKEGIYFEYLCTGGLPRNGQVPLPEMTSKGELKEPYKRAKEASELFKKIIKHYKIKILKVGYVLGDEEKNGILDILAEWNGEKVIIDLKYSGLIDDKWNEMGWETESLPMKDSLMIQGVHYKILAKDILGIEDIPFYYFIFNSKNSTDMKIIRQNVDGDKFFFHRTAIQQVKDQIEKELYNGFKAYPDYKKCKDCPLFDNCEVKAEFPLITDIYY
jgi:hypothetical protein